MNRPSFDQTVSILVKAYLNDTLAHSFCSACAVGNIIAHHMGTEPLALPEGPTEFDNYYFANGQYASWYDFIHGCIPRNGAREQVERTGYTVLELVRIESAFENAPGRPLNENGESYGMWRGKQTDPTWMFNGLMSVVEVLASIHNVDLSTKEQAKLLFVK